MKGTHSIAWRWSEDKMLKMSPFVITMGIDEVMIRQMSRG